MANTIRELEGLAEVISIATARVKASIEFYNNAYDKAVSENARKVFSLLLEQERRREADLRDQLDKLTSDLELERSKSREKR